MIAAPPSASGTCHVTLISVRAPRASVTLFGAVGVLGMQSRPQMYSNRFGDAATPPTRDTRVTASRVALARIRAVNPPGVSVGNCCSRIAAAPVTNGAAIDVPFFWCVPESE